MLSSCFFFSFAHQGVFRLSSVRLSSIFSSIAMLPSLRVAPSIFSLVSTETSNGQMSSFRIANFKARRRYFDKLSALSADFQPLGRDFSLLVKHWAGCCVSQKYGHWTSLARWSWFTSPRPWTLMSGRCTLPCTARCAAAVCKSVQQCTHTVTLHLSLSCTDAL